MDTGKEMDQEKAADVRFAGNRWEIESTREVAKAATDEVERRLKNLGWSDEEVGLFQVVVTEVLANAVIHGNLGLKKEKGESLESYNGRIAEAEGKTELRNKKVIVEVDITPEEVKISILDEGGFDQGTLERPDLSKVDPATYDFSGLGRGIMFAACDEVKFSPGKVVLRKRRKNR